MSAGESLDGVALRRLYRVGGPSLVRQMIDAFLAAAPARLAEARSAAGAGELETVRRAMHSLRSTAGNYGATEVQALAERVGAAALAGDADAVARELPRLEASFAELAARLQGERDRCLPMRRVAVVEDNADNRLLVQAILEGLYAVEEYECGLPALEALAARRPDLLLLDISLPDLDGVELLRRIRDDPALAGLPVIALTAHAMTGDRERYLALGFDEYVTKPIAEEAVLLAAIERLLPPA